MAKEIWKDIKNYEGLYQVSNLGRVRSLCNRWGKRQIPRLKKLHISEKGYLRVPLCKNNNAKLYMVHVLVARTFFDNYKLGTEINHKNYIRTDNRVKNLEIMSHTDNVRYSKSRRIEQYSLKGDYIKTWNSMREIENKIGIDHRQISDNVRNKQKTCHGYIFRYKEE